MSEDCDNGTRRSWPWPQVIQGGMGVGVSGWRLARAVAASGQLGVVSGSLIDTVFVRRLQDGDEGGHMRRAMAAFPLPGVAAAVLATHFRPGGRPAGKPYRLLPVYSHEVTRERAALTILASFCEVWLAREGHDGRLGMNLLTKVAMPNPALLYGAMLAGVDVILMGAGIPREIPGVLDALARGDEAKLRLEVEGDAGGVEVFVRFDPRPHFGGVAPVLARPAFFAIISSHLLASVLAKKASGRVDGFVVEAPTAGGHNAPPRDGGHDAAGEPLYGERDVVDLAKLRALGLPFWLAGGTGSPEQLRAALAAGARGVQVGSLFAFCDESGVEPTLRASALAAAARGEVRVHTDAKASPTGYPFKVARWPGGPSESDDEARERICDLGALRMPYRTRHGAIAYRCPAAPVKVYVSKGGDAAAGVGRKCLCNALLATVGQAQVRHDGRIEPPLVTAGDDFRHIARFLNGRTHYSAANVVAWLVEGSATLV